MYSPQVSIVVPKRAVVKGEIVRRPTVLLAVLALCGALTPAVATAAPAPVRVVGLQVHELRQLLADGEVTSRALVERYLRRIAAYDHADADRPGINAVLTVNPRARAVALRRDLERRRGHVRGPLHGIPVVVKDNMDTADLPTTSGSRALRGLRAPDDATQVRRLRDAGAIVLAKTNLDEYALNIRTTSSLGGQTRNPYDRGHYPGGSSGGTGAAVAAAFAPVGMGSDTCGSLRIPAAHNNLVGLRPTLGLSSRDGVAPLARTQDTVGPLGTSVTDVALVLDATAGHDPADPVTAAARGTVPPSYLAGLSGNALDGSRIGVLGDRFADTDAARPTNRVVRAAVADMVAQGAEAVELGPQPEITDAAEGANRVADEFERDFDAYLADSAHGLPRRLAHLAEPESELTLADVAASGEVHETVLPLVRALVDSPALPNPAYEEKLRQRDRLRALLTELMRTHGLDALVYPSITEPPPAIGTAQPSRNCQLAGHSGFPALSLPAGFTGAGLPVGVELLGLPFSEPSLLAMGHDYERATGHRTPPEGTPPLP